MLDTATGKIGLVCVGDRVERSMLKGRTARLGALMEKRVRQGGRGRTWRLAGLETGWLGRKPAARKTWRLEGKG